MKTKTPTHLTRKAILASWFGTGREVENLCRKFERAILETLEANPGLADGKNCTLAKLKLALKIKSATEL